ncbi:UDP-galactose phosphate transferase [Neosynechococcus sphagnicola sy1]|uniref:UDP-galactose phosphate transferase n=1 Tax=Neosynechococcus sphagnicola sy1 TaxID=1497020 RepID=A0A098TJI7_9CYAN|nr:sugar transferase [Neosynechococcus sphagnicola]KGF72374.1 UDP-galactose phosphate transferase [Neosynechococcus sphagnicola sy1]
MTQIIKRFLDFIFAFLGLILLSPVLMAIAIAIYLQMGYPILFTQLRPGYKGKLFTFYKFRTMTNARDPEGNLLPDGDRLTRLGQFLRQTSLDELPQLWNVLKGEMSFVGPRPLLVAYLDRYTPEQARRHDVKPGITGWSQINGRNHLGWQERFELDVWYVDHANLWLDCQILLRTIGKVVNREGINQEGQATMEEFKG